ncbi:hypothetical protein T11_17758 [Trichinella zimbabwensis]|uniref:Uncharacterized protein n=1 Tax=Trichinella zimbabwensis TaxID=268475 RepID=A0A0V1GDD7_9BILA|nr:hypothetical protein T11_17758 [Trichinella zimbabwensis]
MSSTAERFERFTQAGAGHVYQANALPANDNAAIPR